MFGSALTWIENELARAGVTTAMVKQVAMLIFGDLFAGKSKESIVEDVLVLFRNKQL